MTSLLIDAFRAEVQRRFLSLRTEELTSQA